MAGKKKQPKTKPAYLDWGFATLVDVDAYILKQRLAYGGKDFHATVRAMLTTAIEWSRHHNHPELPKGDGIKKGGV